MIDGLKPYPAYKPTSLPWLRETPTTWEVCRNGRLFAQRNETGFPDLPILEVSLKTGVRVRDFESSKRKQVMSDKEKYKRARSGDIAYNMMRMWQGAVGVSPVDGLISPAYVVARPFPETNSRYFELLFRTGVYMHEVNQASRGIVSDRNRLYWEDFKQLPSPCPPPEEQAAIVQLIDHADRRIRRYIRLKRKLIALLNEQKQAIINQAVTRGLDPHVKLKPSGVEWLGDVPEHFSVLPLKRLIRRGSSISYGIVQPGLHLPGGVPFLQTTNISKRLLSADALQCTSASIAAAYPRSRLKGGDVVLGIRASIGAAHVVPNELTDANLSRGIARIVPGPMIQADYLVMFLRSRATSAFWDIAKQGTTFNEVSIDTVRQLPVVVPPLSEQQSIVRGILELCSPLDTAIASAESEISLIQEYRTRLIADVVTGKLDVREAAANLPDEAEEPEAVEEPEDLAELDEEMEGEELEEAVAEAGA